MNAHGTASCNGILYRHFVRRLDALVPSILVIDKLTCNVSVRTRHRTLARKFSAINMLTRNLSHVCPTMRHHATARVLARNKLLARFVDNAGPSQRGFIGQGHVMTNVDSTALIMRSNPGNNSLVATRVTRDCRHSYFTFPNHMNSACSANYGLLVRGGHTTLVRNTRSIMGTVG